MMRLIDADAIKYCTERQCFGHGDYGDVMRAYKEDIDKMPTIDPETLRPTGRWVMKETMIRSMYAKNAYCSECLEETAYSHNYCPNCGAKMEG